MHKESYQTFHSAGPESYYTKTHYYLVYTGKDELKALIVALQWYVEIRLPELLDYFRLALEKHVQSEKTWSAQDEVEYDAWWKSKFKLFKKKNRFHEEIHAFRYVQDRLIAQLNESSSKAIRYSDIFRMLCNSEKIIPDLFMYEDKENLVEMAVELYRSDQAGDWIDEEAI